MDTLIKPPDQCMWLTCEEQATTRGYCQDHYASMLNYGVTAPKPKRKNQSNKDKTCTECDQPAKIKGLCLRCYKREYARSKYNRRPRPTTQQDIPCKVCGDPSYSYNLCSRHYQYCRRNNLNPELIMRRKD